MIEQLPTRVLDRIKESIENNKSIIVSGESDTGKSMLIKDLLNYIPKDERVTLIGDFDLYKDVPADGFKVEYLREQSKRIVWDEISGADIMNIYKAIKDGQSVITSVHSTIDHRLTGSTAKVVDDLIDRTMREYDERRARYDGVDIHDTFYQSVGLVLGVDRELTEDAEVTYNIRTVLEPHEHKPIIVYRKK